MRLLPLAFGLAVAIARPTSAWPQTAPSQVLLNGFLIGQAATDISDAFPKLFQADTTEDGWVYRTYILDRATHSYMSFKFPTGSEFTTSVQIAGAPGTPMIAFSGVRLGSSEAEILEAFGPPSEKRRLPDWPATAWDYDDRNYSFEVDTLGQLSSIQVFGYQGLVSPPDSSLPDLKSLSKVLAAKDPDALLPLLAGDFEGRWHHQPLHFKGAARSALADSTTDIFSALYGPEPSLLALLTGPPVLTRAIREVRLGDVRTVRYRPAEPADYPSIVFVALPGGWRIWEIDFGP